jgi:hypothetical protein
MSDPQYAYQAVREDSTTWKVRRWEVAHPNDDYDEALVTAPDAEAAVAEAVRVGSWG